MADGTADQPILFTAKEEVLGTAEDNDRGLWGGLVINGYAPINDCPEGADGGTDDCIKEGEANSGQFGGSNGNDNSGVLRYVGVRFAGSNVDPENQLNGIAFQAVGDATVGGLRSGVQQLGRRHRVLRRHGGRQARGA